MKNAGYGAQEGIAALIQQGFALTNNNPGYGLVPGDSNPTPPIVSRYFALNETTRYATIPEVTLAGDFSIGFSLLSSSVANGDIIRLGNVLIQKRASEIRIFPDVELSAVDHALIPLSLSDGVFHDLVITGAEGSNVYTYQFDGGSAVHITSSGSATTDTASGIYQLCYGGFGYFNGILANLRIYDNGTLIRDYPIDDDSNTLVDHASGQNGTVINGIEADWGDFVQEGINWRGQDLTVPPWESTNQLLEVPE